MERTLEDRVELAKQGDKAALEEMLRHIQDRVYGLALRMLWHPADAEDASQEILIKVLTHLGMFRHDSSFHRRVFGQSLRCMRSSCETSTGLLSRAPSPLKWLSVSI